MSFGDIAPKLSNLPASVSTPEISELQRLLKPLSANNAVLRNTTLQLRQSNTPPKQPDLNRIRALRLQNQQIAHAASDIVAVLDVQLPALQGDTLQLARDTKRNFTTLLDEFLVALRDSAQAESHVLSAMRTALISELPAEERQVKEPKESDALLLQAEQERRGDEMVFAQERWEMLSDIESSIHDVNSIFSDLAGLIAAQGTAVEHVETTTEDAAQFVDRSNRELHVSKFRQARNKNLFFTLLIIVASIIAVFLIILLN